MRPRAFRSRCRKGWSRRYRKPSRTKACVSASQISAPRPIRPIAPRPPPCSSTSRPRSTSGVRSSRKPACTPTKDRGQSPDSDPIHLCHAVLLEPGEHALPAVLGGLLAVGRPEIGMEAVRHAFVDVDLGLLIVAESFQARAQALDLLQRNALVGAAV